MDLFLTDAAPSSWQHLTAVAPPWLAFWSIYRPDVLGRPTDRGG